MKKYCYLFGCTVGSLFAGCSSCKGGSGGSKSTKSSKGNVGIQKAEQVVWRALGITHDKILGRETLTVPVEDCVISVDNGTKKVPDGAVSMAFYSVDGSSHVFYLSVKLVNLDLSVNVLKARGFEAKLDYSNVFAMNNTDKGVYTHSFSERKFCYLIPINK